MKQSDRLRNLNDMKAVVRFPKRAECKFNPARIGDLCEQEACSGYKLARLLDVKPDLVIKWADGVHIPNMHTIEKICSQFGVDPNFFFDIKRLDKDGKAISDENKG